MRLSIAKQILCADQLQPQMLEKYRVPDSTSYGLNGSVMEKGTGFGPSFNRGASMWFVHHLGRSSSPVAMSVYSWRYSCPRNQYGTVIRCLYLRNSVVCRKNQNKNNLIEKLYPLIAWFCITPQPRAQWNGIPEISALRLHQNDKHHNIME